MKSTSTINPVITENTECLIIKVCALFINLKLGVSPDHGVLLRFILLLAIWACWAMFQAKNNLRNVLPSSLFTLVSHQSHKVCTTYTAAEKGMELKGEQR